MIRRFLLLLCALTFAVGAPAQNITVNLPASMALRGKPVAAPVTFDSTTLAIFAAMGSPQPTTTRKNLYAVLIACVEGKGTLLSNLDWWNILAVEGGNSNQALVNFANPAKSLVIHGTGSFASGHGYVGNGTTDWLSYNEGLAASPNKYSLNSAALGAWWNGTAPVNSNIIGTNTSSNNHLEYIGTGQLTARISNSTGAVNTSYTAQHYIAVRRVDSANLAFYGNGILLGGANVASATTDASVSTQPGSIAAARGNFTAISIAMTFSGNPTAQNITDMYTCALPFLTAIGAQ